jgi:hypothetical protein
MQQLCEPVFRTATRSLSSRKREFLPAVRAANWSGRSSDVRPINRAHWPPDTSDERNAWAPRRANSGCARRPKWLRVSEQSERGERMDEQTRSQIETTVKGHRVVLFMKGTRNFPQ